VKGKRRPAGNPGGINKLAAQGDSSRHARLNEDRGPVATALRKLLELSDLDHRLIVCAVVDRIRQEREAHAQLCEWEKQPRYWLWLAAEHNAIALACRSHARLLSGEFDCQDEEKAS
jgi:hypothetical protein